MMMSVPFAVTPCGSIVPSGNSTVSIFSGTHSRNSIQLIRSISRVVGPPLFREDFIGLMRCRGLLLFLRLYLSIKRGHADADHVGRLLSRTIAVRERSFDVI